MPFVNFIAVIYIADANLFVTVPFLKLCVLTSKAMVTSLCTKIVLLMFVSLVGLVSVSSVFTARALC